MSSMETGEYRFWYGFFSTCNPVSGQRSAEALKFDAGMQPVTLYNFFSDMSTKLDCLRAQNVI